MSKKFAQEFRDVADKYISGPQSKALCQMMAHNAFLTEHRMREVTEGKKVVSALAQHMYKTIQLMRQTRERMLDKEDDDEPDEEAPSLA